MRTKLALLSLPLLFAFAVAADPPPNEAILAAIEKGREAVNAGKDQEAIEALQKAIGLIQAKGMKNLATFLPTRDDKWEMGEVDTQTGNWGSGEQSFQWSQVSRQYRKKGADNGPEVNVMISNSPQLIEAQRGMIEMLKNPEMRKMLVQGGQKIDFIEEGGWVGMVTTEGDNCSAMIMHTKLMVQIQVNQADAKLVKEFWSAMDKDGLAATQK